MNNMMNLTKLAKKKKFKNDKKPIICHEKYNVFEKKIEKKINQKNQKYYHEKYDEFQKNSKSI